ncbi:hypothetical protein phiOC_p287 [Ochrobactrum phage vB_OspM_OC]|nr:hypothetical protein phiOC_p287 [Ochrobactrum phage vB_OspM_OC]
MQMGVHLTSFGKLTANIKNLFPNTNQNAFRKNKQKK